MKRALPLFLIRSAAGAVAVMQFRAEDFGPEWTATRGGAVLSAVHPATNGWTAAFSDGGGVSFAATSGVASPLVLDSATTGEVSRAMLVADCAVARPWEALLDAPTGAALAPRAFEWEAVRFAESNCLGVVAVSVDGVPDADMSADSRPHLVEIEFLPPVSASDLYLGGHPATPAWNRSWRGRVFEALFCFGLPSETSEDAIRAYLSLRWRLGLDFRAPPDIDARLRALGVDPGNLYATILILR